MFRFPSDICIQILKTKYLGLSYQFYVYSQVHFPGKSELVLWIAHAHFDKLPHRLEIGFQQGLKSTDYSRCFRTLPPNVNCVLPVPTPVNPSPSPHRPNPSTTSW